MRRVACIVLLCVASVVALLGATNDGKGERYEVDAVFDNAAFLIPGQDVKIAGAIVGEVTDVTLTEDRKARVRMEIEPG